MELIQDAVNLGPLFFDRQLGASSSSSGCGAVSGATGGLVIHAFVFRGCFGAVDAVNAGGHHGHCAPGLGQRLQARDAALGIVGACRERSGQVIAGRFDQPRQNKRGGVQRLDCFSPSSRHAQTVVDQRKGARNSPRERF
jgi:hypothetical protein